VKVLVSEEGLVVGGEGILAVAGVECCGNH